MRKQPASEQKSRRVRGPAAPGPLLPARRRRRVREGRRDDLIPLLEASLIASLEHIQAPAFIVGPEGVSYANGRGHELLRQDAQVSAALEALARDERVPDFSATPLRLENFSGYHLAVLRDAATDAEIWLQTFAARLRLTPRETEVLGLLVQGLSNRTIGECLRCAERTVEQHLRFIYSKAGAETRAALIARFWTARRG